MLTREAILAANDLPTETVPVPEWGGEVTIRTLTAGDFLKLLAKLREEPDRAYAHWLVAAVADAQGRPLFTDADAEALAGKSITVIERLLTVAQRLNPLKRDQAEKN